MSNWKFYLANSSDLSYNKDISGEARGKQLSLSHNRSGNFEFNLPMTAENLYYTQCVQTCVICLKNNNIVWSGPIWTRSTDFAAAKINFTAVGWFEILMNRFLWNNVPTYTSQNEGYIALQLLNIANTDHPTWITMGTNTATSTRSKKYEIWQNIGEEIISLSDIEDGFDLQVDPETRELNIKEWDDYEDRTEIPFGLNWGPDNISNLVVDENGGEMRNRIQVVGANSTVYTYNSNSPLFPDNSQDYNGVFTEIIQATEESDANVLQAIANAHGAIKQWPITNYDIQLKPQGPNNPYEIFEDYNIGDKIYATAQKSIEGEKVSMEIEPRIFGATIAIDDNGTERVSSLQTTFSGS
mgnify:CR=1 FL=1